MESLQAMTTHGTDKVNILTLSAHLSLLELIQQVQLTGVGGRFVLTLDVNPRDGASVWLAASHATEHPSGAMDAMELGPVRVTEDGALVLAQKVLDSTESEA